jgi:rubrerythrin
VLEREGFKEVRNLQGGIHAWQGLTAAGSPEAGMAYFQGSKTPGEIILLARELEEGSRRFYSTMAGDLADKEASDLFSRLADAEGHHRETLETLHRELSEGEIPEEPPSGEYMEGGSPVAEVVEWAREQEVVKIIKWSMALETNAYDLYIKMTRLPGEEKVHKVFKVLAEEEKGHLKRLSALLDQRL